MSMATLGYVKDDTVYLFDHTRVYDPSGLSDTQLKQWSLAYLDIKKNKLGEQTLVDELMEGIGIWHYNYKRRK